MELIKMKTSSPYIYYKLYAGLKNLYQNDLCLRYSQCKSPEIPEGSVCNPTFINARTGKISMKAILCLDFSHCKYSLNVSTESSKYAIHIY